MKQWRHICVGAFGLVAAVPALAMELSFPANAVLSGEASTDYSSYLLPISGLENNSLKTIATKGAISQQAWKISASTLTSLELIEPLREQIVEAGFEVLFECDTEACGGYDFRYEIETLPEPVMHVDLGDFRFLSAKKPGGGDNTSEYLSLIVSRSAENGYVQMMRVGDNVPETRITTSTMNPAPSFEALPLLPLASALEQQGRFILEDLIFQTGSSALGDGEFESLTTLATYLQDNPSRKVTLVGHTDAEGSLAGNIALSKKRARSVMARLVAQYGISKNQLNAEGNGFLSPRASNLTDEGRTRNRRVEVILNNTDSN